MIKTPHQISEINLSHLTLLLLLLLNLVTENQGEALQRMDDLEGVGNLDEKEGE